MATPDQSCVDRKVTTDSVSVGGIRTRRKRWVPARYCLASVSSNNWCQGRTPQCKPAKCTGPQC
eukprot:5991432-Amphidinium_carterae.1